MNIQIKTRGPAPQGADLIGLKEALASAIEQAIGSVLEQHGFTVDRIDIQEVER